MSLYDTFVRIKMSRFQPFFVCYFNCSVSQLTEYSPQELIEKTLYQFIHPADVQHIRESHVIRKFEIGLLVLFLQLNNFYLI